MHCQSLSVWVLLKLGVRLCQLLVFCKAVLVHLPPRLGATLASLQV